MALLLKAARERVEVPCESMNQMKNLQMRLHMLRGAMGRERHPNYGLATRVHTSCTWDFERFPSGKGRGKQFPKNATGCTLVLHPKDSQFAAILEKAGVKADEVKIADEVLDELPTPNTPNDPTLQPTPTTTDDSTDPDPYRRFK